MFLKLQIAATTDKIIYQVNKLRTWQTRRSRSRCTSDLGSMISVLYMLIRIAILHGCQRYLVKMSNFNLQSGCQRAAKLLCTLMTFVERTRIIVEAWSWYQILANYRSCTCTKSSSVQASDNFVVQLNIGAYFEGTLTQWHLFSRVDVSSHLVFHLISCPSPRVYKGWSNPFS